mgnify:FL=1
MNGKVELIGKNMPIIQVPYPSIDGCGTLLSYVVPSRTVFMKKRTVCSYNDAFWFLVSLLIRSISFQCLK